MICFSYMPKGSRIRQFYLMIKILVLVWYINKKTWSLYQLLAPHSKAVGIAHYNQNEQL